MALFEHNKPFYPLVKEKLLAEDHTCCLVSATGIGKSNIAITLIDDFKWNTLIISPAIEINDQWYRYKNKYNVNITCTTYQYFTRHWREFLDYDCYVFDEAHHLGYNEWGAAMEQFKEYIRNGSSTKYILGLTADDVRYYDRIKKGELCPRVSDIRFDGNLVEGLTIIDAIELGIIQKPIYISPFYSEQIASALYYAKDNFDLAPDLLGEIDLWLEENNKNMTNAFDDYKSIIKKGIAFAQHIKDIPDVERLLRKSFPDFYIGVVNTNIPASDNEATVNEFMRHEHAFLITVNMYREGVHIEGINTVVMLRRTNSPSMFQQQIGRCTTMSTINPIIFDFAGNNINIHECNFMKILDEVKKEDRERKKTVGGIRKSKKYFISEIYGSNSVALIEKILYKLKGKTKWAKEEDDIIREYFPKMGYNITSLLKNRSLESCINRARMLKVSIDESYFRSGLITCLTKIANKIDDKAIDEMIKEEERIELEMLKQITVEFDDEVQLVADTHTTVRDTIIQSADKYRAAVKEHKAKDIVVPIKKSEREWEECEDEKILRCYRLNRNKVIMHSMMKYFETSRTEREVTHRIMYLTSIGKLS